MQADLNFATQEIHDSRITLLIDSRDNELVEFKVEIKLPNLCFSTRAFFSPQMLARFIRGDDAVLIDCDHKFGIIKTKHEFREEYRIDIRFDSSSFIVTESDGNFTIEPSTVIPPDDHQNLDRIEIERVNVSSIEMNSFINSLCRIAFT